MVEVQCAHCGTPFLVKPYRLQRNKGGLLFCSADCRNVDGRTHQRDRALPDLACPECGRVFYRKPAERRPVNWCSYECAAKGSGNLKSAPKGARRSPSTEFQPGMTPANKLPVGTERMRYSPRHGDTRWWVKVAEPNRWRLRAVIVWEAAHGPVPRGAVVHHRNRDRLDDRLENLATLTRAEHLREHRPEFEEKRASRAGVSHRRSSGKRLGTSPLDP